MRVGLLTTACLLSTVMHATCHGALLSVTNRNSVNANAVYELSPAGLADGALVNIDRTHTFTNLPAELEGADYILTANDDKTSSNLEVTVTFDTPTTLYLSIDNRVGNENTGSPPSVGTALSWVPQQGWAYTGLAWEKVGDAGNPLSVYRLVTMATSHTFYAQDNGGARNMYSIAARAWPGGPLPYTLIDIGPAGQRVEAGAGGLDGAPNNGVNATNYGPAILSAVGFLDTYQLAAEPADWRDRGNSTGTIERLVLLGEDFIKNNDGTVTLRLDGLPRGRYEATSYHHDADNLQSPRIQVYVSDAVGGDRLQPTHGDASQATTNVHNLTTAVMTNSAASFAFYATGDDPVVLRFHGTPGTSSDSADDETPVNGLALILADDAPAVPHLLPFALIDIGPDAQRVEPGAMALLDAPGADAGGTLYPATPLTADTGAPFTFAINNLGTNGMTVGGIDWRDRGDSTGTEALVWLGEDHVKNNLGVVRVTLGDLPAGSYRVESMHGDASASNNQQCEEVRVYVTDARGVNVLQNLAGDARFTARGLNNLTTRGIMATASAYAVEANGTDDVIIIFDGTAAADTEVPLNGLRIETVTFVQETGTILMVR